jgi:hypothetical protein
MGNSKPLHSRPGEKLARAWQILMKSILRDRFRSLAPTGEMRGTHSRTPEARS